MELLERGEFFDELEAILETVAAGIGRIVLVSGEAGIGKTALVEGFAERHSAKARVFWGACDALFTPRPLGPLYDIAPQTQGELLTLLEQQPPPLPFSLQLLMTPFAQMRLYLKNASAAESCDTKPMRLHVGTSLLGER